MTGRPRTAPRSAASKVPVITAWFWFTKVLTTGMGEATSDFMVHRFNPYLAVGAGGLALAVALVIQFAVRRYVAWIYWLAVVMVGVFGTMAADAAHIGLGIAYWQSTAFFAVCLAAVFGLWYASEKTLSIHSVRTRRRELFYWAAVLATFALGTAAGDLLAFTLRLGFLSAGFVFAAIIAIPVVGVGSARMNLVLGFWFAYVVTRPLGASFADWAGQPRWIGGLGFGDGTVSLVLTALIVACVAYLTVTRRDVEERAARRRGRHRGQARSRRAAQSALADPW